MGVSGPRPYTARVAAPRRRRPSLSALLKGMPLDGIYAFVLVAAMLFVQQLGSLSGLLVVLLPLAYAAFQPRRYFSMLASKWLLFLFPLFAVTSFLWSELPGVSLRYGLELVITIAAAIGLLVGRPNVLLKGIFLAFLAYGVASVAFGHFVGIGTNGGGVAFTGLGDGKNLLADIATLGTLVSMTVLVVATRQKSLLWWGLSAAGVALQLYMLFMARSAGAVLGLAAAMTAALGVWLACAAPRYVRVGLVVLLTASGAILISAFENIATSMVTWGLRLFDKDPTLTGRTYLWYRANDLIAQKPFFGRGYWAFWQQGNSDAEGLWQYAGITGRSGFNFHNTPIAVEVELGYVGLAIFLIIAAAALIGLMKHVILRPTLALSFWVGLVSYFLIRAPFEAFGTAPFYYSTALLFAGAAVGLEKLAPAPSRTRPDFVSATLMRQRYFHNMRSLGARPGGLTAIDGVGKLGTAGIPQT